MSTYTSSNRSPSSQRPSSRSREQRSLYSSEASIRSTFHRSNTPAGKRSESDRSRSAGRRRQEMASLTGGVTGSGSGGGEKNNSASLSVGGSVRNGNATVRSGNERIGSSRSVYSSRGNSGYDEYNNNSREFSTRGDMSSRRPTPTRREETLSSSSSSARSKSRSTSRHDINYMSNSEEDRLIIRQSSDLRSSRSSTQQQQHEEYSSNEYDNTNANERRRSTSSFQSTSQSHYSASPSHYSGGGASQRASQSQARPLSRGRSSMSGTSLTSSHQQQHQQQRIWARDPSSSQSVHQSSTKPSRARSKSRGREPLSSSKSVAASVKSSKSLSNNSARSRSRSAKKIGCLGQGSVDMTKRVRGKSVSGRSIGNASSGGKAASGGTSSRNVSAARGGRKRGDTPPRVIQATCENVVDEDITVAVGMSGWNTQRSSIKAAAPIEHSGRNEGSSRGRSRSQGRSSHRSENVSSSSVAASRRSKSRDPRSRQRSQSRGRTQVNQATTPSSSTVASSRSKSSRGVDEGTVRSSRSKSSRKGMSADAMSIASSHHTSKSEWKKHLPSKIKIGSPKSSSSFHDARSQSGSSTTSETGPLSNYSGKSSRQMPPQDRAAGTPTRAATPNGIPSRNNGDDDKEIITSLFDRRGYCVRHPNVRLRKKKILGGWNILISNCPDCCVEEMGRLKRISARKKKQSEAAAAQREEKPRANRSSSRPRQEVNNASPPPPPPRDGRSVAMGTNSLGGRGDRRGSRANAPQHTPPNSTNGSDCISAPIFEFDIPLDEQPSYQQAVTSRSVKSGRTQKSAKSSKSTRTNKSTKTSKSAKSTRSSKTTKSSRSKSATARESASKKEGRHRRTKSGSAATVASRSSQRSSSLRRSQGGSIRVAKMPYTDHFGREGLYTGYVNNSGLPDGNGSLHYNDGTIFEGHWIEGQSDDMDLGVERKQRRERHHSPSDGQHRGHSTTRSVHSQHAQRPPQHHHQQQQSQNEPKEFINNLPWSDINGFSGHYTGEINSNNVPDGRGRMQYINGVVEDGMFSNGVYQPPLNLPEAGVQSQYPSSSVSVWSIKSSPTMVGYSEGSTSVMGSQRRY